MTIKFKLDSWKCLVAFALVFNVFTSYSIASEIEGEKGAKPVKKALVMYGEETLFNSIEKLSDEKIQEYHDSLRSLPSPPMGVIEQIELFLEIKTLSKLEIALLLDSLFDAGDQHYALINQVNLFIVDHDFDAVEKFDYINADHDFPAHLIYGSWNTTKPHPYPIEIWKNDSSQRLKLADQSIGDYASPLKKVVVTSTFGYRWDRMHRGIDLDLQVWDTVASAFSGKVRFVGYFGGYGRTIVVRHHNGLETLYAHLHRFKVNVGDEVKAGQLIGLGGSSGNSTGSHLHFECRYKGVAINPSQIINFKDKKLVKDKVTLIKNNWGYTAIPDGVEYYTVKRGDYLMKIADMYGTTCKQLCDDNQIKRNTPLRVGQKIRIL